MFSCGCVINSSSNLFSVFWRCAYDIIVAMNEFLHRLSYVQQSCQVQYFIFFFVIISHSYQWINFKLCWFVTYILKMLSWHSAGHKIFLFKNHHVLIIYYDFLSIFVTNKQNTFVVLHLSLRCYNCNNYIFVINYLHDGNMPVVLTSHSLVNLIWLFKEISKK